jgi:hypothetical protein
VRIASTFPWVARRWLARPALSRPVPGRMAEKRAAISPSPDFVT